MKILLINKYHFLKGGAERAYFDMAEMLEAHGHEVAFFSMKHPKNIPTRWEKYFVENVEYQDDQQSLFRRIALAMKILFNFEAQHNMERLIEEFRPDIVHVHNIYHQLSPSLFGPIRKRGIPIVMTLHDYKLVSPNYSLFVRGKIWEHASGFRCIADRCVKDSYMKSIVCAFEQWLHMILRSYDAVNVFVAPSRFLIDEFYKLGFRHKITYLPNPLIEETENRNMETSLKKEKGTVLFFGRLSVEKGVETLIEAMALVPEKRLWIVGDGPDRNQLEKLVETLGLADRVVFFGSKYGEELESFRQRAQIIVIPSVWFENFPYVLIESLRSGAAVIASDLGGMAERIRHGENGFLFEAGNVSALASLLGSLDESKLSVVREHAKESVADLTEASFFRKLSEIYEKLLSGTCCR
jgi:glycosyltransferase involved in cell wall biosynthesis